MKKIGFITLGCKVNIYESNALEQELMRRGFMVSEADSTCDAFVINTCSVTNTADQKSRQMVSKARRLNPEAIIAVIGCYVQTNEKAKDLEVDILLGNGNKKELPELLEKAFNEHDKVIDIINVMQKREFEPLEVTTYDHSRAFVKIEDGCNQFCSYCIIPYARGPIRSKKADDVISELQRIVESGYEEVVLSGIHTGKYKDGNTNLSGLIRRILKEVPSLKCLRISSIEINEIDDELIQMLKESPVLANHFHLPLQSGCDKILKLMNRPYTCADFKAKVEMIRAARPDIALTTDVICGFPYEDDVDHQATIAFIREIGFSALHVFPYSKRSNTPAARMPQVDGNIKKARSKDLLALSSELEAKYYQKFVGQTLEVILEQAQGDYMVGHTSNFLLVHVKADNDLVKKRVVVTLTDYKNGKLYGIIK